MFATWSIRRKLALCIGLLLCTVGVLLASSLFGVTAFRGLAKSIRLRAGELPLSSTLAQDVSQLHVTYRLYQASLKEQRSSSTEFELPWEPAGQTMQFDPFETEFEILLTRVVSSFENYSAQLTKNRAFDEYRQLQVHEQEQLAVEEFDAVLRRIQADSGTVFTDAYQVNALRLSSLDTAEDPQQTDSTDFMETQLTRLESLANELPRYLHSSMENFADEVRWQYRTLMGLSGVIGVVAFLFLLTLGHLLYVWVFRPLEILVQGSRRVANGDFEHQIQLDSHDEIAELANAMNGMTRSFREIRDDLNQKVQQRTKEVVRSEQLASVGFLAAGVAHEINNPLASIAMCAESLEQRLQELAAEDAESGSEAGSEADEGLSVVQDYLKMIQDEAFRCKEITERLLDFSRLGDVEKQQTNLTELVESVIRMIQHLGRYKAKEIEFRCPQPVFASVNSKEIKQVILNLLTNSLDSLDAGGRVTVDLVADYRQATLTVRDNGCGMTDEVLKNLFEPFFTRRRDGQGTGLGMSITYRIIHDHGGDIQPYSAGPGLGSQFVVSIPLASHDENQIKIRQAA